MPTPDERADRISPFDHQWNSKFAENRVPEEIGSYVDVMRKSGLKVMNEDVPTLFTTDENMSGWPNQDFEDLVNFIGGASSSHIEQGRANHALQQAWLHDSCHASQTFRQYAEHLSPKDLRQHLGEKRFNHDSGLPDANQRLICISDLEHSYAYVLAETATEHQVPTLRCALSSYLDLSSTFQVATFETRFPIFQLLFSLPFYVFRDYNNLSGEKIRGRPSRKPMPLSFLTENESFIFDAHVSFAICGTGEIQWTAYLFVDTYFNRRNHPETKQETNGQDGASNEGPEEELDEHGEDFLGDRLANRAWDAKTPKWNPREYFLSVVQIWLAQAVREWDRLVRVVKKSVVRYIETHPCVLAPPHKSIAQQKDVRDISDWVSKTMVVLETLHSRLRNTNKTWSAFSALEDGDVNYFTDFWTGLPPGRSGSCVREALSEIKRSYRALKAFQGKLEGLKKRCEVYGGQASALQQSLSLQIAAESCQTAQRSGFATELGVWAIAPIAIVSTFFGVPTHVIEFPRNTTSFVISVVVLAAFLGLVLAVSRFWLHITQLVKEIWEKLNLRDRCLGRWVTDGAGEAKPANDERRIGTGMTGMTLVGRETGMV